MNDPDFERLSGPEHYLHGQEYLAHAEAIRAAESIPAPDLLLAFDQATKLAELHFTAANVAAFGALLVSNETTQGDEGHIQQVLNWAQVLGMRSAGVAE